MTPRFDVVGIVVADMARSLAFYRRLGLEVPSGAADAPHVEVPLPNGMRLAFDTLETIRSFDPTYSLPAGRGGISLAFECGGPAGVDACYRELVDAGSESHREPWDAFWGQRYACVRDPDANGVDLFAPLPVSE